MRIHTAIIDDFFKRPYGHRSSAIKQGFQGVVSPKDGVLYPGIQDATDLNQEVKQKLAGLFPTLKPNHTFFRLSTWGEHAPHQAHTDKIMGEYTLIVYLSEPHPKVFCGTTLLEHTSGQMPVHPDTPHGEQVWTRDTNNAQAWNVVGQCEQKFNRAFIMRSDLFHRAEPIGGYGHDAESGRLVLVCFFDVC